MLEIDRVIFLRYKGISHYEQSDANNHTALPCPGELLVEEHHSNYGEPWAGGRDVFEFLAESILHQENLALNILNINIKYFKYI